MIRLIRENQKFLFSGALAKEDWANVAEFIPQAIKTLFIRQFPDESYLWRS
jgi:hypothetical protein